MIESLGCQGLSESTQQSATCRDRAWQGIILQGTGRVYTALQGKNTKSEALRQAQIALITGNDTALGEQRRSIVAVQVRAGLKPEAATRLNHPYYWA
ncbi:MAG TPA: CHAT domain-containing protein, partial [Chroococcales cyanobacterium]